MDGSPIEFEAGQFLTFSVEVDGVTLRRAYSLASPQLPDEPRHVTVKRMPEGRVSHYLNDHCAEGTILHVLGPSGNFLLPPLSGRPRHAVFIAGGSGITPVMSLLGTVLATEPASRVTLIYGNRRREDIIFAAQLAALRERYGDRLRVDHVLNAPPRGWTGGEGLLDPPTLQQRFDALGLFGDTGPSDEEDVEVYLCGPSPMMQAAHEALRARAVPAASIREERFTQPEARTEARVYSTTPQPMSVQIRGLHADTVVKPGQTLLEAGLEGGIGLPFSCAMGGCGTCKVKLREGEVEMDEPNCLSAAEREAGYVLTCVGHATGPCVIEVER